MAAQGTRLPGSAAKAVRGGAGLADLVIERLRSQAGRRSWDEARERGIPRAARLVSVVHETTGLDRIEGLQAVMDEVDTRILSGALLESPKVGPALAAAVVGPSARAESGAFSGRLL